MRATIQNRDTHYRVMHYNLYENPILNTSLN
ncbi:hypothetical protein ES705_11783 [subsurface metagenome]